MEISNQENSITSNEISTRIKSSIDIEISTWLKYELIQSSKMKNA